MKGLSCAWPSCTGCWAGRFDLSNATLGYATKPGVGAPGVCWLSCLDSAGGGSRLGVVASVVGRSCWRWHLGPGVVWDVPWGPGHLKRCNGRRLGCFNKAAATRQERQRSVKSVGAGAGSSARSWLVLRGVSSIDGASESRCSHYGGGIRGPQGLQRNQDRSSPEAMGVHEGGFHAGGGGQAGTAREERIDQLMDHTSPHITLGIWNTGLFRPLASDQCQRQGLNAPNRFGILPNRPIRGEQPLRALFSTELACQRGGSHQRDPT